MAHSLVLYLNDIINARIEMTHIYIIRSIHIDNIIYCSKRSCCNGKTLDFIITKF